MERCKGCGLPVEEGYFCDWDVEPEIFCSEECLLPKYPRDEFDTYREDGEIYWTTFDIRCCNCLLDITEGFYADGNTYCEECAKDQKDAVKWNIDLGIYLFFIKVNEKYVYNPALAQHEHEMNMERHMLEQNSNLKVAF